MIKLADYQKDTVEKLVRSFKELRIANQPNSTLVLKSPTGSGKTVMVSALLDRLLNEPTGDDFVYIWASMGDLAHQSYEKLKNQYLLDSEYKMIEIESIQDEALPINTILFCNWEKLYTIKKERDAEGNEIELFKNVYVRVGESGRNLQNVLDLTRKENRKIILIVDEAHRTYLGKNSQKLVERVIQPTMTIEVSATPIIELPQGYYESGVGRWVEVNLRDVIDSQLIKKNTIINNNIGDVIDESSTDTAVLAAALKQRELLAKKYKEQGSNVNPLVLIQLPTEASDRMSEVDLTTKELVEDFMESKGITYENGKLAIWVSGNHYPSNVKTVTTPNDSPIEVLIFKQAIATGWDCPRAAILVMLRDIRSVVFEIQTVGRIMRMPELKHYSDDALNTAYVFTNINEIALHEDADTKAFYKTFTNQRVDDFNDLFAWPNCYRKRIVGQRHRLNQNFRPIWIPMMNDAFHIEEKDSTEIRYKKIDDLLEIYPEELSIPILADVAFEHLDTVDQNLFENSKRVDIGADKPYIERTFNAFLFAACSPYAPHDSSRILKNAIYKWFSDNGIDDEFEVQRIIACSEANQRILLRIMDEAKSEFAKTLDKETEVTKNLFSIPEAQEFGDNYSLEKMEKHVLQPYYRLKNAPNSEIEFEEMINKSDKVDWWYRNGSGEPKYFGVIYSKVDEDGEEMDAIFYPDYIVKFTDNTIGIFDTKSGDTAIPGTAMGTDVDRKANGLQYYLRNQTGIIVEYEKEGFNVISSNGLWGGIINVSYEPVTFKPIFDLQKDAIDHTIAVKKLNGESPDVPDVNYDCNAWNRFRF